MKPTLLKPGMKVVCHGRQMTFLRREKNHLSSPVNWFQCADYRGLNGPNDDGKCTLSDSRVSREVIKS